MESSHPPLVRTRLSAMMFLEFFVWGSWGVTVTGYAGTIGFSGGQIGWLGAVTAIGAIISPLFVGLIADRFFSAQRMLSVLHLVGGACLIAAGYQDKFTPLMLLMMVNGLMFMPTIALVNSVAFRHIPDADKFPRIALFGTFGWIAAIMISSVLLGGATSSNFLIMGGIGGIVLAFYAWTLPDTPPKGAEAGSDVFGLRALTLFRESSFRIFIGCVFLVGILACGYFFTLIVPMLQQRGYPAPVALTSLCQFAEIVFMFSMPWFVAKLGLKRVILIGMVAWAVRYLCFASTDFTFALIGLILHGFCYSFFYVGSYMYVDRRAPEGLKSSAQSLLAVLFLGVGWLIGANGGGFLMSQFPGDVTAMPAVVAEGNEEAGEKKEKAALPRWDNPEAATSAWRYLDLNKTVDGWLKEKGWLKKDGTEEDKPDLDLAQQVDGDKDGKITVAEIAAFKDPDVTVGGLVYSKENLVATFKTIHEKLGLEGDVALDRSQWLEAQSCKWKNVWLGPSIALFVILLVFAFAFRDKPEEEEDAAASS